MKVFTFFLIALTLFIFIFIRSNTWQTTTALENRAQGEYLVTHHSLHWDRFFTYIKNTPDRLASSIKSFFSRL